MNITYIIGTAGSGKSLLTSTFVDWLQMKKLKVISVNLDPGVISLPYTPDVDVRDFVSIEEIIRKYGLGPNGSIIMAADLIAMQIDQLRSDIESFNADYVVVDTPGQMELFAFRASGPYIAEELCDDPKAIIYLFDASFSSNPLNYVSNMFLAVAVHTRFLIPQVYALSKVDILPIDRVETILEWGSETESLDMAIDTELKGNRRLLSLGIERLIKQNLNLGFNLIPISAKTLNGFIQLESALTRVFSGGEMEK